MGRGSSGIGAGGSDGFEKRGAIKVAEGNGSIDLSDSPLRYGGKDSALDGARRASVEAFESRYMNAKIENGATFDADGNITEKRRGGKGSVKTSIAKLNAADAFSHNHPRGDGVLGGTFSEADLSNFSTYRVKTFRAASKEGVYSISKGKNFDATGFRQYYKREYSKITQSGRSALSGLNKRVRSMPYETYLGEYNKAMNKMLVDLHNVLISGQKEYGYSYTLERR